MRKNRTYYEKKECPVIYCDKCGKEISNDGFEERPLIGFLIGLLIPVEKKNKEE